MTFRISDSKDSSLSLRKTEFYVLKGVGFITGEPNAYSIQFNSSFDDHKLNSKLIKTVLEIFDLPINYNSK
ncbi:MAG: hypothetical protein DRI89_15450 [Bacteroidetes bacterium]|nr:MAG: hypothetical protein DRI89_15450 [Bacteroidota bacterium]